MTTLQNIPEAEVDRLRELAHIGAGWAAAAFGQIASRTILTRVPVAHGPERFRHRSEWRTGVFFEAKGSIDAVVAIFLTAETRDAVIETMLSGHEVTVESAASALCEFGNMLASQTVSAIADTLGSCILLGLPDLVMENAEAALEARLAPRHGGSSPLYIESELFDRQGEYRALHVVLPELPKAAARAR